MAGRYPQLSDVLLCLQFKLFSFDQEQDNKKQQCLSADLVNMTNLFTLQMKAFDRIQEQPPDARGKTWKL
jgi:hypothetical protein